MADYADLVIEVTRPAEGQYWVEMSFTQPDQQTEQAPVSGPAHFDFNALRAAALAPDRYGRLLNEAIFAQENLRSFYKESLAKVGGVGQELRLRILIDRSALELHNLRWEALRDLDDQYSLATNPNQPFSRFLYTIDWQKVELRSKGQLRALVFVANPADLKQGLNLARQKLAEVDVAGEVQRARTALQGIPTVTVLASQADQPGQATQKNLETQLRQGYDILYLVAHGGLLPDDPAKLDSPQRPYLLLEKDDGAYDPVPGNMLLEAVRGLPVATRPRLVVLVSCQSGGQGKVPGGPAEEEERSYDQGALAALGPRLVEAGIPALIAMQDNIKMETVKQFIPAFFTELLKHGQVDKAMAVARNAIRTASDWWVPVLYLRLRGGLLWYEPGFMTAAPGFEGWPSIISSIKKGYCVPILGFGLLEFLAGSPREIARRWAKEAGYPLAPGNQDSLPQVAQYLSIQHDLARPRDQLVEHIQAHLVEEYAQSLPPDAKDKSIRELISEIGRQRREADPVEGHLVLASLPFKIYVTTNPDNLLEDALIANKRPPTVMYAHWKRSLVNPKAIEEYQNLPTPSVDKPLVYHLFGFVENPRALVLTEDDYFDYMMWVNNAAAQIQVPEVIRVAWDEGALLFLGFQMNDWNFRVLFRSILNDQRRQTERYYRSVAVQLQPGDGYLQPEKARRYLERAFAKDQLDIYWGSAEDFLRELQRNWR